MDIDYGDMYYQILELRVWAVQEFKDGYRSKASRIMKVAERLSLRRKT